MNSSDQTELHYTVSFCIAVLLLDTVTCFKTPVLASTAIVTIVGRIIITCTSYMREDPRKISWAAKSQNQIEINIIKFDEFIVTWSEGPSREL